MGRSAYNSGLAAGGRGDGDFQVGQRSASAVKVVGRGLRLDAPHQFDPLVERRVRRRVGRATPASSSAESCDTGVPWSR